MNKTKTAAPGFGDPSMKNILSTTLSFTLLFGSVFAQNNAFEYTIGHVATINPDHLKEAKLFNDIIPYYSLSQYNMLYEFSSLELSASCNGKILNLKSTEKELSSAQKELLTSADAGNDITVKAIFKSKDTKGLTEEMIYTLIPNPENTAQFPGGMKELSDYLLAHFLDKVPGPTASPEIQRLNIAITIDEQGQAEASILNSSLNPEIDSMVLSAINKMPNWKPAENSNGKAVKQKILWSFGGC